VRDSSSLVASDYAYFLLRSIPYGATATEATLEMDYNSPEQQNFFSSDGVEWDFPATDGVHLVTYHAGKTVPNGTIAADGTLSFLTPPSLTGITHVALATAPYALYPLVNGKVVGATAASDVTLVIWDESDEDILVVISAEKTFAEQCRIRSTHGLCQDFPIQVLANIIAAEVKFLCGDYKGAHLMVDHITKSCNCA
jgi:hypothetical protein